MDCSEVILKIESSIAKVIAFNSKLKSSWGIGTGFVYENSEIIVTCNHVVRNLENISYFIKFPDKEDFIIPKILLRDEEHDIALLGMHGSNRNPLVKFDGEVKKGIEVLFSGYPLDLAELTTHQGIISSITKDATGITTYMIDGTVNPGNSGCPLMSKDGRVIGIVNAQRRERKDVLDKVEKMYSGVISIQNIDLADIYKALMSNLQLGIGYAIPASYIPIHKEIVESRKNEENTETLVKNKRQKIK